MRVLGWWYRVSRGQCKRWKSCIIGTVSLFLDVKTVSGRKIVIVFQGRFFFFFFMKSNFLFLGSILLKKKGDKLCSASANFKKNDMVL
jgi:hypothetical protein